MITADLYDFDKTIFKGESCSEFYFFCLKRHPKMLKYLPVQAKLAFEHYALKRVSRARMIEKLYAGISGFDAEKEAELFWQANEGRICEWFKPTENDVAVVVCSASPLFQIKPICDKLGVSLIIATDSDPKTGIINGEICRGEEKVRRLGKEAPEYCFRDVYTDNIVGDAPILSLATRDKYEVCQGNIKKIN